jgi:hypothetical protein
MSIAQVVVDTDQLDGGVLAEVGAACARARAEVVPWRRTASAAPRAPALLIGALRRGERRIPSELVDAATQLVPDAGLLLLSDEPLVRPVVSTQGGRVTLLARPASAARIRGTVRMLLAERGDFCRERLDAHVWTAVLEPTDGQPPPPSLRQDDDGALTALFPLIHGWSGAEPLSDEAHTVALARIEEDERRQRLGELLGNAAGLIHLAAGCRQWTVYWPSSTSPLLLCSPLRLPRLCNLADGGSRHVLHLTASPGDLIVAAASELSGTIAGSGGLNLADGGAAFLEQLEAQLAPDAAMPSGLVVEIR